MYDPIDPSETVEVVHLALLGVAGSAVAPRPAEPLTVRCATDCCPIGLLAARAGVLVPTNMTNARTTAPDVCQRDCSVMLPTLPLKKAESPALRFQGVGSFQDSQAGT